MNFSFEWDKNKDEINFQKHKVSFSEAKTVFYDDFAKIYDDPDHSIKELRELIIGYSIHNNLLIISFTQREDRIRLISARKVTKNERKFYEEYKN